MVAECLKANKHTPRPTLAPTPPAQCPGTGGLQVFVLVKGKTPLQKGLTHSCEGGCGAVFARSPQFINNKPRFYQVQLSTSQRAFVRKAKGLSSLVSLDSVSIAEFLFMERQGTWVIGNSLDPLRHQWLIAQHTHSQTPFGNGNSRRPHWSKQVTPSVLQTTSTWDWFGNTFDRAQVVIQHVHHIQTRTYMEVGVAYYSMFFSCFVSGRVKCKSPACPLFFPRLHRRSNLRMPQTPRRTCPQPSQLKQPHCIRRMPPLH